MKLTVELTRSPATQAIAARVCGVGTQRGSNLLAGRSLTKITSAERESISALRWKLNFLPNVTPEVSFIYPAGEEFQGQAKE